MYQVKIAFPWDVIGLTDRDSTHDSFLGSKCFNQISITFSFAGPPRLRPIGALSTKREGVELIGQMRFTQLPIGVPLPNLTDGCGAVMTQHGTGALIVSAE